MNILEKLKMKCPVDEIKTLEDAWDMHNFLNLPMPNEPTLVIDSAEILLKNRKEWQEMLEALIYQLRISENDEWCEACNNHSHSDDCILVVAVENATHKSWQEIIKLLEEK